MVERREVIFEEREIAGTLPAWQSRLQSIQTGYQPLTFQSSAFAEDPSTGGAPRQVLHQIVPA